MSEVDHHKIDSRFDEGSFQAAVFDRLERMPEDFQEKWWPVFDPEDDPRIRELFYPAAWAAMDVADNYAKLKSEADDKEG